MRRGSPLGANVVAAAVLAAGLVLQAPVRAQSAADVSAARDLFIDGSKLSAAGNWAEAQDRFERSLKLKRAAITLYSLAVVETHTGRLVEALENFRAFLAEPSAPATKAYEAPAAAAAAELEHRIAHCVLAITPRNLPDLSLRIDGEAVPVAALGVPRVVNPGKHVLTASARGFRAASVPFTVAEGASATVAFELQPAPVEATPLPRVAVVPGLPPAPPSPVVRPAPAPSRVVPLTLVGVGGAFLVAGAAVGLAGVKQASDAPTRDGPDASAARTKGAVGDVLGGVGAVGAGVGLVLLIVQATHKRDATTAAFVTPMSNGLAISF